jgi:hypothetical protein
MGFIVILLCVSVPIYTMQYNTMPTGVPIRAELQDPAEGVQQGEHPQARGGGAIGERQVHMYIYVCVCVYVWV